MNPERKTIFNKTKGSIGEFDLIREIEKLINTHADGHSDVVLGAGDDCSIFIPPSDMDIVVTCDCAIEDKHYLKEHFTPFDIGRRAMVMNVSDIASMGGMPLYGLISLELTPGIEPDFVTEIYRGFLSVLEPINAKIIGGNISSSNHISIHICLIGGIKKGRAITRANAEVGDTILVTGFPGQSSLGLELMVGGRREDKYIPLINAYIRPEHRLKEAQAMADSGLVNSMIDISDGLSGDLAHICEKSNVGAEISMDKLPLNDSIISICKEKGGNPHEVVLGPSDDYELIFTCRPGSADKLKETISSVSDVRVSEIGKIVESQEGMRLVLPDGTKKPLNAHGWDHFDKYKGGA